MKLAIRSRHRFWRQLVGWSLPLWAGGRLAAAAANGHHRRLIDNVVLAVLQGELGKVQPPARHGQQPRLVGRVGKLLRQQHAFSGVTLIVPDPLHGTPHPDRLAQRQTSTWVPRDAKYFACRPRTRRVVGAWQGAACRHWTTLTTG